MTAAADFIYAILEGISTGDPFAAAPFLGFVSRVEIVLIWQVLQEEEKSNGIKGESSSEKQEGEK